MSIANALICAVLFYGFLVLLGRATITLCRQQFNPLETHAISPVIGLAVLTLLTTYLSFLNIPLGIVSKNLVLSISILATITLASPPIFSFKNNGKLTCFEYFLPVLATAVFVALPFIMGGYQFVILRGNGTDAFNYVTMSDGLSRYPLDWILTQTKETLAAQSPNLPLAQELLKTRWSTSALLGFVSSALGISSIEFEYTYTLILMIALFNALVGALFATKSLNRLTIWLPVVFVVGFWGQFTLDIRAFSQITSLPILVTLLGWLLSANTSNKGTIFRYGVSLTAILSTALFFQYPEVVVAFLPGAGLIFLLRLWKIYRENELSKNDFITLIVFLLATLILCSPLIKFVISFAFEQGRFAVNKSLGWESAYFAWMKNPIRGLWGVGINPGLNPLFDNLFGVIAFLVTFLLTLGVALRMVKFAVTRQQWQMNLSESRLFLLAISGLAGAIVLVTRGNPWAAGKVISYFSILIPIWMAIVLANLKLKGSYSRWDKASCYTLTIAILAWSAMNFVFGGARIAHAINGTDFPNYIAGHGEYRRINAEALAQVSSFNCPIGSSIAIFESTPWKREFLTHLVEGRGFLAITPGFLKSRSIESERNGLQEQINCIIADRKYFDAISLPLKVSNQHEFVVGQLSHQFVTLLGLEGGYGIEINRETDTQYVWTGQQVVLITFMARATAYDVELKLCPGNIRGVNEPLTVFVDVDDKRVSQHEVRECVNVAVKLIGNKEAKPQQVRLTSIDPRTAPILLGLDSRDLRLRVEVMNVRLTY